LRYIPVTSYIPSLEERTLEEKKELILSFFKEEAKKTGRKINISSSVYNRLMEYVFTGNIEQLKNCIKYCCANAFLYSKADGTDLNIYLYHLPHSIIAATKANSTHDEESRNLISIDEFEKRKLSDIIIEFYNSILSCFSEYQGENDSINNILAKCYSHINKYFDYHFYNNKYQKSKFIAIDKAVNDVCKFISEKYNILLPMNCAFIIASGLQAYLQIGSALKKWEDERNKELDNALDVLKKTSCKELAIAEEISELVRQNIDLSLFRIDFILLILCIKCCNKDIGINSILGMILCHGYQTASSIADATNKLIGRHTFEAIDMPLNTKVADIIIKLRKFIGRRFMNKDIILLIDMGSLEDINESIKEISNINIGLANNVSTKLALDVGFQMWQGNDIETILKSACEDSKSSYKITVNQKKEEAILFISDTGIGAAERMSELFVESMPKAIDAAIVSYDYYRLIKNGKECDIFNKYDVKLILGPVNPNIEDIPFISIGDIIAAKGLKQIKLILSRYLAQEDLDIFNLNFIKNFSLLNVVKHLTILNPETLIGYIEEAVIRLQQITGKKLSTKTIIGLYIHISGLIERLITKTPIESYENVAAFETESEKFIKPLREAFKVLCNHYAVEIPVGEIAYIYDFIGY
ncbi:MAG: PRD domain-containing protein, partial [Clostridiales bacterium]|nr:PRD domain-containing protein [Clostridiales bacterium]